LQILSLQYCSVQPGALAALSQLRALHMSYVTHLGDASAQELLLTVSQLTLLTRLRWRELCHRARPAVASPAAFTALTASSNLRSLELAWSLDDVPPSPVLFRAGVVYPHLHVLHLSVHFPPRDGPPDATKTISEDQLQLLCSCCPALQELSFVLCPDPSPTAFEPLLQLSALTDLWVHAVGAAAPAAIGVAAQLTGLQNLYLGEQLRIRQPTMLQLTALTALTELELMSDEPGGGMKIFYNEVITCWFWQRCTTCPQRCMSVGQAQTCVCLLPSTC
jgi:hypothetical protein